MRKTIQQKNSFVKLLKGLCMTVLLVITIPEARSQCTASYASSTDTLNNGNVSFSNTSVVGTGIYYEWNFGDGTTSYSANPGTHNFLYTGTYQVCLSVYDSLGAIDSTTGCYNTYCSNINITNDSSATTPSCTAHFTAYDSLGYGYFTNASTGSGITSTWNFGDGTSATGTGDITHLYSSAGTYTVCLSISNALGTCSDSFCDTVMMGTPAAGSCYAAIYYNSDSSATGIDFNPVYSGSVDTYSWNFGDGTTSTLATPNHVFPVTGSYNVCLTASSSTDTTCSYNTCSMVTIAPACSAYFAIVQDSSNLYNYLVYNYASSAMGAGMMYLWDFGDGTTSTLAYPTHTYSTASAFNLCLTITDSTGCTASHCDSINAGHGPLNIITLTVVNGATGIQESALSASFSNYPNPFSGNTTITYSISKDAPVQIVVLDLLGNKVATIANENKSAGEHTSIWNAEGLSQGMYLLQFSAGNYHSVKKIILEK